MKLIRQKGLTDCGVACVAMIAKVPYSAAAAAMNNFSSDRTHVRHLRIGLSQFGIELAHHSVRVDGNGLPRLGFDSLLKTRPSSKNNWHWMVWDHAQQMILDPGKAYKNPNRMVYAYLKIVRS